MRKVTAAKPSYIQKLPSEAVEAYISGVPEPARSRLRQLREIIRATVPEATFEVISYGIPAFALPKPFFGYAAFKKHLSVLPFSGSFLTASQKNSKATLIPRAAFTYRSTSNCQRL
jgi:uncharacterized protein YdhG (YjbR/CyaY superfamily)